VGAVHSIKLDRRICRPRSRHVRFTSRSDRIDAAPRTVALCHERTHALQQVLV